MSKSRTDDEEYRKAVSAYRARHMSNAKWYKVLSSVAEAEIDLPKVRWKFIASDHELWNPFPEHHDLLDDSFADGKYQPFEHKWIESMWIPRSYRVEAGLEYFREQGVDKVAEILGSLGEIPAELLPDGLLLAAYSR